MKKLSQVSAGNNVFVLETEGNAEEKERLHTLGVLPENIITVIQNPSGRKPMIIEVMNSRFAIGKELAKDVIVSNVLDNQSFVFDSNHKKTGQRALILKFLKEQKGHFSLSDFTEKMRKKDLKIGKITIYRTLKFLEEKEILEALEMPDGERRFEIKKGHHHHIICENCGEVMEFHNEEMENLKEKIAQEHKVKLNKHRMDLFADSCPKCRG